MKNQLTSYNAHTNYQNYLNKFNDEELEEFKKFSEIINICIENMEDGKIYKQNDLSELIRRSKKRYNPTFKRVTSYPIIGYLFCKSDKVIWDNCSCGEIGSFKLIGDNNERN